MQIVGHLINGEKVVDNGRVTEVYTPSTGEVSKKVALADKQTVEQAIAAAQAAFPAWRNTPPAKRAAVMFRFRELLQQNADKIIELIGQEHGKIKHDAAGELQRGIENVEYACSISNLLKGEHSRNAGPNIDSWSEFQPLGVVVGITPFNFPAMVPLWMYPSAIACGNTFILKPSEKDPSSTLFIAELLCQAGLPKGVLNVVNGDKEAVDVLLADKRVEAVSFVGSTPIAESIYQTATANGKRCQALGGAKNHAVVMPDADMDNTVNQLLGAAFGSSGERCMALSVVLAVGDEAANTLVDKLTNKMTTLKAGAYHNEDNDFGALISQAHLEKVTTYINSAEADGAKIIVDGRKISVADTPSGYYFGATLIDNVNVDMDSYKAEIFGPVLQILRVPSLQQAMDIIDAHEYGNGSCIFTRDGEAARYFTDHINIGMVGVNVPLPVPVSYHSFGGWKRSLFGDLSAYGPDSIRFYTRRKTITQRWPSKGVREGGTFSFK